MAELVYAEDLKSLAVTGVWVRVPPHAQIKWLAIGEEINTRRDVAGSYSGAYTSGIGQGSTPWRRTRDDK